MGWTKAPSVAAGLAEATRRWPKRSTASDGTIGDTAHAARKSDHNPDDKGVVHAFDLTHDPKNGVDCDKLAEHLIRVKDKRVEYIIWNKRICNASDWTWKAYTGKNGHTHHMHVSIKHTKVAENDTSDWWNLGASQESVRQAIIKAHNIVERKTWGAQSPKKTLAPDWDYDSIVVHHSGNWGTKTPKGIEAKHRNRGFDDVGYHYMIHPEGPIYEGRSIFFKGAHVDKANTRKIGILMLGDYDEQWWDFDDDLSAAHLERLKGLIATLKKHFTGIKYLGGHLEYAEAQGDQRTCPGSLLMAEMNGLRKIAGLAVPTKLVK